MEADRGVARDKVTFTSDFKTDHHHHFMILPNPYSPLQSLRRHKRAHACQNRTKTFCASSSFPFLSTPSSHLNLNLNPNSSQTSQPLQFCLHPHSSPPPYPSKLFYKDAFLSIFTQFLAPEHNFPLCERSQLTLYRTELFLALLHSRALRH